MNGWKLLKALDLEKHTKDWPSFTGASGDCFPLISQLTAAHILFDNGVVDVESTNP